MRKNALNWCVGAASALALAFSAAANWEIFADASGPVLGGTTCVAKVCPDGTILLPQGNYVCVNGRCCAHANCQTHQTTVATCCSSLQFCKFVNDPILGPTSTCSFSP